MSLFAIHVKLNIAGNIENIENCSPCIFVIHTDKRNSGQVTVMVQSKLKHSLGQIYLEHTTCIFIHTPVN